MFAVEMQRVYCEVGVEVLSVYFVQWYKHTADQHRTTSPTWPRSHGQLSGWRDHQNSAAAAGGFWSMCNDKLTCSSPLILYPRFVGGLPPFSG